MVVTVGLGSLVYGFSLAEHGWGSPLTIAFLAVGVVLLALFVWIESRVAQPLLPLRIVTDRVRGGAFLIQAVAGSVMIGATLYLTFHLQIVLGMSPSSQGSRAFRCRSGSWCPRRSRHGCCRAFGPRPLMIGGPLVAAAALVSLSFITPGGDYLVQVLAPVLVMGVGMAFMLVPLQNVALAGSGRMMPGRPRRWRTPRCRSAARSACRSSRRCTPRRVGGHATMSTPQVLTAAYGATFIAAAVGMVVASVIAFTMIRGTRGRLTPAPARAPVLLHAG